MTTAMDKPEATPTKLPNQIGRNTLQIPRGLSSLGSQLLLQETFLEGLLTRGIVIATEYL